MALPVLTPAGNDPELVPADAAYCKTTGSDVENVRYATPLAPVPPEPVPDDER